VSADPLEVQQPGGSGELNEYAYVSGRALQGTDPLGLTDPAFTAAYDQARHADDHPTSDEAAATGSANPAPTPGVPNEMNPVRIGTPHTAPVKGATKEEQWDAAKAGAQNWAADALETVIYGPAIKLLGGKSLQISSLRAPEPPADPQNLREFELRQQYDFMQHGLTFESTALSAASAGGLIKAPALSDLRVGTYKGLRPASDAHHIIQDAAVRDIPGYSKSDAPAVELPGPSTRVGSPHYKATQVQRQAGGGTYGAERRIGYKAMRKAGVSAEDARALILKADEYFQKLGVTFSTPTRIPGNRK
jgi:HNH/Endo VII superfamily toxin with a SHH signature